jgi:hypothetical protein
VIGVSPRAWIEFTESVKRPGHLRLTGSRAT